MTLDGSAVRAGALAAVAICLPVSLLANAVVDDDDPGALGTVLYVAVLAGFVVGGRVAAQRTTEMPQSSAAVAALVAFGVIAVVSIVSNLVAGDDVHVTSLVFNGLLASGAGLLGAALVLRGRAA